MVCSYLFYLAAVALSYDLFGSFVRQFEGLSGAGGITVLNGIRRLNSTMPWPMSAFCLIFTILILTNRYYP